MRDRFAGASQVASAVLYEGYVLYPYRASATKNQIRWQFGVLAPKAYAASDASERSQLHTECLVAPRDQPVLSVRLRFLQAQQRTTAGEAPWDEAVEHVIDIDGIRLLPVVDAFRAEAFHIDGGLEIDDGVVRRREPIDGVTRIEASWAEGPGALIKVAVTVENVTGWNESEAGRDAAMRHSLLGVHTLLAVDDGAFISLLDPPDHAVEAVRGCANDGSFPVLVGDGIDADVVLSSPIILYDHPVIAPESQGEFFDATEIDEILALRVLTLTDEEKAEARRTDERAASIIDRIEAMEPDAWAQLHGTVRSTTSISTSEWDFETLADDAYDPFTSTLIVGGHTVGAGTSVRLHPSRRSDAHDMFLKGMDATVTGIFTDVDQTVLVAVTVDDDPATEALAWQGRALFFHPDEIEVLS